MSYRPNRGGHAPGDLREAFLTWAEEWWHSEPGHEPQTVEVAGVEKPIRWLLGQLWNCTDCVPGSTVRLLEWEGRCTYAAVVRHLSGELHAAQQAA